MDRKAQHFWDWVAGMSHAPKRLGRVPRRVVATAGKHLSPESVVLDVGCGPGDVTVAIAARVASVTALDASPGMIEAARETARRSGAGNIDFVAGDIDALASREARFTAVTAFNVLHYIDDIPAVARTVEALLAPGGLFLSSTACLAERTTVVSGLTRLLTKLQVMPPTRFFAKRELTAWIADGGLEIVAVERMSSLPEYFVVAKKRG